ncbi:MAG: hypothetical protein ACKOPE_09175 [Novosphingobium sp.]
MDREETSPEDASTDNWLAAVHALSVALRDLHKTNPWPEQPLLPKAMNYLMTELWDRCFSQTEIREAFEEAVKDMPRYAGDQETRP